MKENSEVSLEKVQVAIYTVNRHAKAALTPKYLYFLKRHALQKMLNEGHAEKVGIHQIFESNFKKQNSAVLVKVSTTSHIFFFHLPMTKENDSLPNLGALDQNFRNPQIRMSLSNAKTILQQYLDISPEENHHQRQQHRSQSFPSQERKQVKYERSVFPSSYLDNVLSNHLS